ncbi:MAG TPA: hypothetical protein VGG51_13855 [Candidatus Cybelea sp.]|jgi:hypothetical protein
MNNLINVSNYSSEELLKRRIGPDGTPWQSEDGAELDENDAWLAAAEALRRVGGDPPNNGALDKLVEEHGPAKVWFHAVWFRPRVASMKKPPENPVGTFTASVRQDYSISTRWARLPFSRIRHGCFNEAQRAQIPTTTSASDWIAWLKSFEGTPDDVPDDVRADVKAEILAADFGLVPKRLDSREQTSNVFEDGLDDDIPF